MLSVGRVEIVCPMCHTALVRDRTGASCESGHRFPALHSSIDFLDGTGPADSELEVSIDHVGEDSAAPSRVRKYLLPKLDMLIGRMAGRAVLDDGCGTGAVVAEFVRHGVDAYGIDPGSRAKKWESSPIVDRLFRADGAKLPFRDETFDAVVSSGVLEHLGEPMPWRQRLPTQVGYIREALRVMKPGGIAIMAAPNGAHPLDYWHGRKLKAVAVTTSPMRLHLPYERWMPNARRLRRWVAASGYRAEVSFLTPEDFLSFERIQRHWAGRQFTSSMQAVFRSVTKHPALASTPINPWLVACVRRLE